MAHPPNGRVEDVVDGCTRVSGLYLRRTIIERDFWLLLRHESRVVGIFVLGNGALSLCLCRITHDPRVKAVAAVTGDDNAVDDQGDQEQEPAYVVSHGLPATSLVYPNLQGTRCVYLRLQSSCASSSRYDGRVGDRIAS